MKTWTLSQSSSTIGPRMVALSFLEESLLTGSWGGGALVHAAQKLAVMAPRLASLCNWAAALLAYSPTRNESETRAVRYQPRTGTVPLEGMKNAGATSSSLKENTSR